MAELPTVDSSSTDCESGNNVSAGDVISDMYADVSHTSGVEVVPPVAVPHFNFTGVGGDPLPIYEKGLVRTSMFVYNVVMLCSRAAAAHSLSARALRLCICLSITRLGTF